MASRGAFDHAAAVLERTAWLGTDPGDLSALENPGAVTGIAAAARER